MITVIDLGGGGAAETCARLERLGEPACVAESVEVIARAGRIILIGDSSFAFAVRRLRDGGLVGPILRAVELGAAVLGVSTGLHALLDVAYDRLEAGPTQPGQHLGLGLVPGKVIPLARRPGPEARLDPHEGPRPVLWERPCPLLEGLSSGVAFHFRHTHVAEILDARARVARSAYRREFTAVVREGRIFGVQFEPHRSGAAGDCVLRNFAAA